MSVSNLILPGRYRRRTPTTIRTIDYSNPITNGLVVAALPLPNVSTTHDSSGTRGSIAYNAIDGYVNTSGRNTISSSVLGVNTLGRSINSVGSTSVFVDNKIGFTSSSSDGISLFILGQALTTFGNVLLAQTSSTTAVSGAIALAIQVASNYYFTVRTTTTTPNTVTGASTDTRIIDNFGREMTLGATVAYTSSVDGKASLYIDGVWNVDTTNITGKTLPGYVGSFVRQDYFLTNLKCVWNRVLTEDEFKSLTANPYQIFNQKRDPVVFLMNAVASAEQPHPVIVC